MQEEAAHNEACVALLKEMLFIRETADKQAELQLEASGSLGFPEQTNRFIRRSA